MALAISKYYGSCYYVKLPEAMKVKDVGDSDANESYPETKNPSVVPIVTEHAYINTVPLYKSYYQRRRHEDWNRGPDTGVLKLPAPNCDSSSDFGHFISKILENIKNSM